MLLEDAMQMVHAPSSAFSAGEWCEAANVLAEELARLTDYQMAGFHGGHTAPAEDGGSHRKETEPSVTSQ